MYVCAHCHELLSYDEPTGQVGPCGTHAHGQVLRIDDEVPLDP